MITYKNFFSELKPIAISSTKGNIQEDCWWKGDEESEPENKKPLTSIIRMGDQPSAVVIAQDDEPSNVDGSIESTPENPVINNTHDPKDDAVSQDEKDLYAKWSRMLGIKEIR